MTELNDFNLVDVDDAVSEVIRNWEEMYNEVFVLAPGRTSEQKMSFDMKEDIMKTMTFSIITNDKKNGTNNFSILYEKHKLLITHIGTTGILLKNMVIP
jgi:hypothetical protein